MTKPSRKGAFIVLALALVAGAAGWYALSDSGDPARLSELDATSFSQLKDDFNAAVGKVRVVLLLSPT